jgi:hypothetical protein
MGGMDWMDLSRNRNSWLAVVNAVMNKKKKKNAGNFLTS